MIHPCCGLCSTLAQVFTKGKGGDYTSHLPAILSSLFSPQACRKFIARKEVEQGVLGKGGSPFTRLLKIDEPVKSPETVIPAKAGIQKSLQSLDSRL